MKICCVYDSLVPLSELKPHPRNRNTHPDDQISRLARVIEYQGFRHPIVVSNLSGFIVAGHGRLAAAKKLKLKEVPVDYQDFGSEEQEYAFLVSDNAVALWAELDLSGINADIGDLGPDFDIDLLGIKNFEIDVADKEGLTDADAIPEHVDPKTKRGDIYRLGNHRLMCGDATAQTDVDALLNGAVIDMLFTDPPYGMNYSGRGKNTSNKILNDDQDPTEFYNLFPEVSERYMWGRVENYKHLLIEPRDVIVWKKNVFGMGSGYRGQYEVCFYYGNFKGSDSDVWECKKDRNYQHPTQKPVELCERAIANSQPRTVMDLFGGSGSTLIACEKTNRKCFMMELDPHYCDVIVARWEQFTGKKAELING